MLKGYEISGYLDPESYRELPEADRSVEESVFDRIYEQIWPGYRELTTPGHGDHWDDQDLVRDVLEYGTLRPIHPVIFCDEVQDFTQVELSVILCLSPWRAFKLDPHIQYLPYAFAGDPLQTINPTGFRRSILKKYLYEHIQVHLLPNHCFQVRDPQELRNNYRSNPHITRFSNVVNLWRKVLSEEEVSPQCPWRFHEQKIAVQKFILGKNLTLQELRGMLNASTGTICILPCAVGEELDYVDRDPHLRQIFADDLAQGRKPASLQTITAVKGMEFKKIILYKFGENYWQRFKHSLIQKQGADLKLRYFLNQLYVGITRPVEALAIVDTLEGQQCFWEPALGINRWLDRLVEADRRQWQADPPLLDRPAEGGRIQTWTAENLEDVARLAVEFLKRGVEERNPDALTTAQGYARQLGRQEWVEECEAWMAKVEGRYLQAGERFLQLSASALLNRNPKREAWECFWKGNAWLALQQHRQAFAGIPDIPDYSPLVDLMVMQGATAKPAAAQLFNQVVRVRDWLGTGVGPRRWDRDPTWRSGIEEFLRQLEKGVNNLETFCPSPQERSRFLQETCAALTGSLRVLDQRPEWDSKRLKMLGSVYFYQSQFERAITAWDQGKQTEHSLYYKAKIQLEPLPAKLIWLSKDRQDLEVVNLWQKAGSPLAGEWQKYTNVVMISLERLKQWPLLLRVLIACRNWETLWETMQAHPQAWQRGHDYELVAGVARDPAIDWRSLDQDNLRPFMQQVLASLGAEYAWLSQQRVLELGLAYERLGFFRDALDFYSRFTEGGGSGEIRSQGRFLIRRRWLEACKRYVADLQSQGKPTDILEAQHEENRKRWENQDRQGRPIPQSEPELLDWDPWRYPLLEHPSPVQSWILEQEGQTQPQMRLRKDIQQGLEQLDDRQLQQVYHLIQRFQGTS